MIPQETVNLILDTAQIADVVGDFVTLRRRGANLVACCPFHNEKTPSFYVSPSKGIYKCFGCGKAGSAVGFVMEHERLSYVEALKYLARKYNIEVKEKEDSAEDLALKQKNESLMLASEYAGKFFVEALNTPEGRSIGYAYFKSRGLEDATIRKYGLGWAPQSRHAMTDAALGAGYKAEYLLETGLCAQREDGSLYDRFFDRVMFPIHSVSGRIIAFGGRTLRSDHTVAKYVNSKESEIYVKSRSLYGLYFAKSEISRLNECILVEGYLDVLSMHQIGILNVAASSGTSLTIEQIRLIKKFTENVTIMYDGDSAGIHAALRGISLVLAEGLNVKVVLIPDGDDPDSYARKHTLDEVRAFIQDNARDFITFKAELLSEEAGNDPLKKANLINDLAETVAQIPDPVKRSVYVDSLSERFHISSAILFEKIKSVRSKMLSEQEKEAEREKRRREAGLPQLPPAQTAGQPDDSQNYQQSLLSLDSIEQNKTLGTAERDILYLLLKYGREALIFESDSEFYQDEQESLTVTDFIRASMEADSQVFENEAYRKTYEQYMRAYDENRGQEEIVKSLLDSPDRLVAFVTAELSVDKYRITVKNLSRALTTTGSYLTVQVPKAIIYYMDRRLENRIMVLRKALAAADSSEDQEKMMKEIVKCQKLQAKVKTKLKR